MSAMAQRWIHGQRRVVDSWSNVGLLNPMQAWRDATETQLEFGRRMIEAGCELQTEFAKRAAGMSKPEGGNSSEGRGSRRQRGSEEEMDTGWVQAAESLSDTIVNAQRTLWSAWTDAMGESMMRWTTAYNDMAKAYIGAAEQAAELQSNMVGSIAPSRGPRRPAELASETLRQMERGAEIVGETMAEEVADREKPTGRRGRRSGSSQSARRH